MTVLAIYARLYLECMGRALASIGKSPWTLLLPMGLLLVWVFATVILVRFLGGLVAGFILGLVLAALGSCYLYFLGELVGNARVKVSEFGRSVGAYFWSVINVLFVYWIASLVLDAMTPMASPQARSAHIALQLVALVLLNAVPEVIYQRRTYGGLATLKEAIQFLQANWLEWGVPNALLLAALWFVNDQAAAGLLSFGYLGWVALAIGMGALVHVVMVFRGHLFAALVGTNHRQRMYRYRAAA